MKKIGAALLAVICLLLCACNGDGEKSEGKNYVFSYRETTIAVGEKAPAVLDALKDLNPQVSPSPSCLNSVAGEDVTYVYPGFRMQTFRLRENDPDEVIRILTISDDSVATPEGITIGSAQDAVTAAYGAGISSQPNRLVYASKNGQLVFEFRNGLVSSISYKIIE